MKFCRRLLPALIGVSMFCSSLNAQRPPASASSAVVPRLVNFSGRAADAEGKSITGIAGATFAIYKDQYEGSPLWLETQNIQANAKGNYTIQLGATKPQGLPLDLFSSGEARWLGVSINSGSEQPRILLLSVPYALKAADAETVGGLPPSAFVRANSTSDASVASSQASGSAGSEAAQDPLILKTVKTNGGKTNFFPLWANATTLRNSVLFQSSSGQVGLGTTTPAQALDLGNNNNMVIRVDPGNDTTQANGGYSLVGRGAKGVPNTWFTYTASVAGGFGVPANSFSIWQYPPNSVPGCCLNRFTILPAEASTDTGGTVTIDQDGSIEQPRAGGGAVKAMVAVNAIFPPYKIDRCFNSALTGAAATTPPCGINFTEDPSGSGFWDFAFGYEVDDRFYSATVTYIIQAGGRASCIGAIPLSSNTVQVETSDCNGNAANAYFYLIVY